MAVAARKRDAKIKAQEKLLAADVKSLQLDLIQAGLDAAGVVDPTPFSDLAGFALGVYRGDLIGAGQSLISLIPGAGDAVVKAQKGTKLYKKIRQLRRDITIRTKAINDLKLKAQDAASLKSMQRKEKLKSIRQAAKRGSSAATTTPCAKKLKALKGSNLRMPASGTWVSGSKGNGQWAPTGKTKYEKSLRRFNKKMGLDPKTPIEFRNGFINLEPYAAAKVKVEMVGNHGISKRGDFGQAIAKMKEIDPTFDWDKMSKTHTWHHHEDGVTMLLVPKAPHKVPHVGGASLAKEPGY